MAAQQRHHPHEADADNRVWPRPRVAEPASDPTSDETPELTEDLTAAPDPVAAAHAHVAQHALTPDLGGRVGLELEYHLVDLADPGRRPAWERVLELAAAVGVMPSGSSVTLEPGGQVELSTPPAADAVASVAALRADQAVLRSRLGELGFGAAALGTDPARPTRRVNPHPRYDAMEEHFGALGSRASGQSMMSSTAALQVNLDAGPRSGWERRLALVRALTPVLVALSATSPYLAGRASGWHSMRQGCWNGIDRGRSDPFASGEPTAAWADYALRAPVMLVRDPGPPHPAGTMLGVTERISFADWLRGRGPVARPPGTADLDYHLTTLFPPVRPRGYVEIRCIDALPDRWTGALTSLVATLVDDPVAADGALEACAPVEGAWEVAARDGLADTAVRRAVLACLDLTLAHGPAALRPEVESLTELVAAGSSPGQEIRRRVEAVGPLAVLEEEARA
ncbi:MAG: hypothetical protein JWR20_1001 [Marmoricola sp.]|nr:hypothetical protein [Marmoricola sp.]